MLLVQTISQRGSCWFVDNTAHFQTGNFTGFLGGLTLSIVEVGRHGDNGIAYFGTQVVFGCLFHFLKDHSRDFLRSIQTTINVYAGRTVVAAHHLVGHTVYIPGEVVEAFTHETLDG